ncbi:MAG: hypothetical protein H7267_07325 [Sandarakinorhabdus sp.]|nr:hypothetical protein [Sandarakinorhabdus sp.]
MFARLFTDHPRIVGESYFEHMVASFTIAARLVFAGSKCLVHGVIPGLCQTAGSDAIMTLHREISPRRFDQPTL